MIRLRLAPGPEHGRVSGQPGAAARPRRARRARAARLSLAAMAASSSLASSLGDHWQSALSSAVVLPRPDLVAGAGVPRRFWSVNDG